MFRGLCFSSLYRVLVLGEAADLDGSGFECLVRLAGYNKVLLGFLRAVDYRGFLRDREEARFRVFLDRLRLVSRALRGLDHVFVKLYKPVSYVPADIDVLVSRRDMSRAVSRLRDLGYRVEVSEPYCVTLTRGGSIIDLYTDLTLGGGLIYLPSELVFSSVRYVDFSGLEVPVPSRGVEALIAAAHAVYKEKIYTLSDYLTTRSWLSRESIEYASRYCLDQVVSEALAINNMVDSGRIELPHRVPLARWLRIHIQKIASDPIARASSIAMLGILRDPRLGRLIVSKLTRISY